MMPAARGSNYTACRAVGSGTMCALSVLPFNGNNSTCLPHRANAQMLLNPNFQLKCGVFAVAEMRFDVQQEFHRLTNRSILANAAEQATGFAV